MNIALNSCLKSFCKQYAKALKERDEITRDKCECIELMNRSTSINKLTARSGKVKASIKLLPISPIDPSDLVTQLLKIGKKTEFQRLEEERKEKEKLKKSMLEPVSKSIVGKMTVLKERNKNVQTELHRLKAEVLKYLKNQFFYCEYSKRFKISFYRIIKALLGRNTAEKEKTIFETERKELHRKRKMTTMYNMGEDPRKLQQ